mmetsp:Transcript_97380/g.303241  ORF Transcript_97380/g.303241 Transcript_97380/m.303241 type:complete len:395 (-) Transcript_97380:1449-2633(-)
MAQLAMGRRQPRGQSPGAEHWGVQSLLALGKPRPAHRPQIPRLHAVLLRHSLCVLARNALDVHLPRQELQLRAKHPGDRLADELAALLLQPREAAVRLKLGTVPLADLGENPLVGPLEAHGNEGDNTNDAALTGHDHDGLGRAHLLRQLVHGPGRPAALGKLAQRVHADGHLHLLRHAYHHVAVVRVRHLQVVGPGGVRRPRGSDTLVEVLAVLGGEVRDDDAPLEALDEILCVDLQQGARLGRLRPTHVRPLRPERRLAEQGAGTHHGSGLGLHGRPVGLLHVHNITLNKRVGRARHGARHEQVVLRPQVDEVDSLRAGPQHEPHVQAGPEPKDGVLQQVRALDLEAELRAQGTGEEGQRGHVPLLQARALRQPLHGLLLHRHRGSRPHAALP